MESSAEKTKLMTNNTDGINTDIKVNGEKLGTVKSFKYLGSVVPDEGSKPEILSRIAQTTATLTKLRPVWNERNIMLRSKVRLMRSLVISIFLCACESWTLTADLERRIQATEMRCYCRLLGISYKDHITNVEVRDRVPNVVRHHKDLLTTAKRQILKWYGYVIRSTGLAKTILQGTVQGGRRRGRQRKRWEDNITEWTGKTLSNNLRKTENRKGWRCCQDQQWCPNGRPDQGIGKVRYKTMWFSPLLVQQL